MIVVIWRVYTSNFRGRWKLDHRLLPFSRDADRNVYHVTRGLPTVRIVRALLVITFDGGSHEDSRGK